VKLYNDDCINIMGAFANDSIDFIFADVSHSYFSKLKWDKVIPLDYKSSE